MEGADRFAAALAGLEAELDWAGLGQSYCHEGGETFFPPEQREVLRETGLLLAADLGHALEKLPPGGPGRSLWLGAALAEIAPLLLDKVVLEREVDWRNLAGFESEELNRALGQVAQETGTDLPRIETDPTLSSEPIDLLWVVSVFTDPEAFPALHDHLYGRVGSELATGKGHLAQEEKRAQDLACSLIGNLVCPGVLVTTDEELPFFLGAAAERGMRLEVPDQGRLSGVVGDVVRICRLAPLGE